MPTTRPDWPTPEEPGRAIITRTEYGTFGIRWEAFPAMERRGGWSGPWATAEEAIEGARGWIDGWDLPRAAVLIIRDGKVISVHVTGTDKPKGGGA